MRRALRATALLLLAAPVWASEPVFNAADAPPAVYGPLVWHFGDQAAHGYWFTDAQVQRTAARVAYLEDKAARECVERQTEANKQLLGSFPAVWIAGGVGIALGLVGGFWIGRRL